MKILLPILVLSSTAVLVAQAQAGQPVAAAPAALTSAAAAPSSGAANPAPGTDSAFTVAARGADHRVWQRVVLEPTRSGRSIPRVHSYTELSTGMHFRNASGVWQETREQIDLLPGGLGAAATNGPHQLYLPADIYEGVIETVAPDGKRLRSRPMAITYFDGTNSVLLAELTNSIGQLLPSGKQAIYTNAFPGLCDIVVTYRKSGVECDLVFRRPPASPKECGLAPNSRLQLWTEFFDTPDPAIKPATASSSDGLTDTVLDWGALKMTRGRAFSAAGPSPAGAAPRPVAGNAESPWSTPVFKSWEKFKDPESQTWRTFLIEQVPYRHLEKQLKGLASLDKPGSWLARADALCRPISSLPPLISRRSVQAGTNAIQIAKADLGRRPGVVLDYTEVSGSTGDYTFQGDTTYFVSDWFYADSLTIEGGTVVKFPESGAGSIVCWGAVTCKTGPYRMGLFTSENDDSAGEPLWWSSGTPATGAAYYLYLTDGPLKYLRFRWAGLGAYYLGINNSEVWHSQFLHCASALGGDWVDLGLHNTLFSGCGVVAAPNTPEPVHGEHLTADGCGALGGSPGHYTNCLFTAVSDLGAASLDSSSSLPTAAGVYQTVGGGIYYLADNSPHRNAGTTNISPELIADLRTKTTYPPLAYTNTTFSTATTFSPQAQRDTDDLDRGYHYTPLDHLFGGVDANANLTFTPGTAVGWFRTTEGWEHAGHGIHAADNTTITFNGILNQPDYWVRCNTVQEQPVYAGYGPGGISGWTYPSVTDAPKVFARFTRCSTMASEMGFHFRDDWGILKLQLTDCEFLGGNVGGYDSLWSLTNCLFDRASISLQTSETFPAMILRNCTVRGGGLGFAHWESGPAHFYTSIRDTIFDGSSIGTGYPNDPACVDYDYNAFLTGSNRTNPQGANDVQVADFNWQTSWLGNYYLPTNSTLVNTGSVANAALVGLYHYTTQTNQVKEANSRVDIGYHYVAVDANGNPIDTDGDGIPDYIEDANGNGAVDSGETDWQSASDLGLKVLITRPKNNSVVP
jgi:hypothetical protein